MPSRLDLSSISADDEDDQKLPSIGTSKLRSKKSKEQSETVLPSIPTSPLGRSVFISVSTIKGSEKVKNPNTGPRDRMERQMRLKMLSEHYGLSPRIPDRQEHLQNIIEDGLLGGTRQRKARNRNVVPLSERMGHGGTITEQSRKPLHRSLLGTLYDVAASSNISSLQELAAPATAALAGVSGNRQVLAKNGAVEEMLRLTTSAKSLTSKLDAWDALEQVTNNTAAAREFVQKEGLQAVFETCTMPKIRSGRMSEADVQRAASRLCIQILGRNEELSLRFKTQSRNIQGLCAFLALPVPKCNLHAAQTLLLLAQQSVQSQFLWEDKSLDALVAPFNPPNAKGFVQSASYQKVKVLGLAMSAVEFSNSALRVAFYDWHNITFPTRPSLGMPARAAAMHGAIRKLVLRKINTLSQDAEDEDPESEGAAVRKRVERRASVVTEQGGRGQQELSAESMAELHKVAEAAAAERQAGRLSRASEASGESGEEGEVGDELEGAEGAEVSAEQVEAEAEAREARRRRRRGRRKSTDMELLDTSSIAAPRNDMSSEIPELFRTSWMKPWAASSKALRELNEQEMNLSFEDGDRVQGGSDARSRRSSYESIGGGRKAVLSPSQWSDASDSVDASWKAATVSLGRLQSRTDAEIAAFVLRRHPSAAAGSAGFQPPLGMEDKALAMYLEAVALLFKDHADKIRLTGLFRGLCIALAARIEQRVTPADTELVRVLWLLDVHNSLKPNSFTEMRAVIPDGHAEVLISTLPRLLVVLRKAVPLNTFSGDLLPDEVRSQRNIVGLLNAYVTNIKSFRIRAIKLGFIPLWQRLFNSAADGPVVIQATRSVLAICQDRTCRPYFTESGGSIAWMVARLEQLKEAFAPPFTVKKERQILQLTLLLRAMVGLVAKREHADLLLQGGSAGTLVDLFHAATDLDRSTGDLYFNLRCAFLCMHLVAVLAYHASTSSKRHSAAMRAAMESAGITTKLMARAEITTINLCRDRYQLIKVAMDIWLVKLLVDKYLAQGPTAQVAPSYGIMRRRSRELRTPPVVPEAEAEAPEPGSAAGESGGGDEARGLAEAEAAGQRSRRGSEEGGKGGGGGRESGMGAGATSGRGRGRRGSEAEDEERMQGHRRNCELLAGGSLEEGGCAHYQNAMHLLSRRMIPAYVTFFFAQIDKDKTGDFNAMELQKPLQDLLKVPGEDVERSFEAMEEPFVPRVAPAEFSQWWVCTRVGKKTGETAKFYRNQLIRYGKAFFTNGGGFSGVKRGSSSSGKPTPIWTAS